MASKNIVNKEIDLIEKASYQLDLIEQRLILLGIVTAKKTGKGYKPNEFVIFTVQDYMDVFKTKETKTEVYGQLKRAVLGLYNKEFTLINKKSPHIELANIRRWRWIQERGKYQDRLGIIEFVFSDKIREYIKRLEERFTQYPIERIASMTSIYPIRLYEILIRWYNQDIKEIKLEVTYLQALFALEDTYKLFADFKRRIIDVAVKQINEYSDLECSYTQHKTGHAVTHLIFNFDLKPECKIAKAAEQAAKEVAKEIKLNSKPAKKRTTKPNVKPEPPMPKIYTPEEVKPTGEETDEAKKGKEFLRNFLQRKKNNNKSCCVSCSESTQYLQKFDK